MDNLCRKCYYHKNGTCKQISRVACTLYELGKNQGLNPIKNNYENNVRLHNILHFGANKEGS